MSDRLSFFAELKRRNVYKVAVAYAVVSWLLIQIATQVFPFFDIPSWAVRLVVLVLVLGFPVALILSWAFEITPEGIKRESEIQSDKSITPRTGRKIVAVTIALAVVAAGLFVYQLVGRDRRARRSDSEAAENGRSPAIAGSLPAQSIPQVPNKSIAVLPFENLSDDKANGYFAEGIQDEILTRLSKIADLKVISRTSTQKYKSAPGNLREIGQQLGVANVIEGSVQKIANAVHVNVQLIRAATDEHVWAESYNRKLDDVFAVEGEVASAIAEQLSAKLSGTEQKAVTAKPTENTAAYDAYLRGLAIEHTSYGYGTYQKAAGSYAKAVELDPNFGLAWARLAILRSFLYFNMVELETNSADAVKVAADRAMSLAPDLGESHVAQGSYRYRVLRDFEAALSSYKKAQQLLPNNALVNEYIAFVLRRLGRWEEAEPYYRKAIELDPLDVQLLSSFGAEYYLYLRRFKEAHVTIDRAIQVAPDADNARAVNAGVFMSEGRLTEADQEMAKIPADAFDDFIVYNRLNLFLYERKYQEATDFMHRRIQALPPDQPTDSWVRLFMAQAAFCHDWLGQKEEARQLFERVVHETKSTPDTIVKPEANGLPSTLALAYAGLGDKEKALEQATQGVKDYETDAVNKPGAEIVLAQIQVRFGQTDAAIAALPRLLQVPAGLTVANLTYDPMWDPIREDPRFQKLLQSPVSNEKAAAR
jgi:TolB-like protein/Tfp pilus assembly protein PilF